MDEIIKNLRTGYRPKACELIAALPEHIKLAAIEKDQRSYFDAHTLRLAVVYNGQTFGFVEFDSPAVLVNSQRIGNRARRCTKIESIVTAIIEGCKPWTPEEVQQRADADLKRRQSAAKINFENSRNAILRMSANQIVELLEAIRDLRAVDIDVARDILDRIEKAKQSAAKSNGLEEFPDA